jgi:hypothetical protein
MTQKTFKQAPRTVGVTYYPHPFTVAGVAREMNVGKSLSDMVSAVVPEHLPRQALRVYLDGHEISRAKWPRVRPKAAARVIIRCIPLGGGGGKNPLRTILSLAVMAASPVISSALTGVFGAGANFLGISAGRLITGGVNLLGRLAINALAPPGRPRFSGNIKESPTLFIQGARNQALPFGRVPKALGQHRCVPPLGALPYTETAGNDQYIRMLFIWGYGPLRVSDLKIGETAIESFTDVEIETRHGYPDDAPLTLFTNSVIQNDLDVLLTQAGGHVVRTTAEDAEEISVDITFQRGLVRFSGAQKVATSVQVELQYAPAGTDDWSLAADVYTDYRAPSTQRGPRR